MHKIKYPLFAKPRGHATGLRRPRTLAIRPPRRTMFAATLVALLSLAGCTTQPRVEAYLANIKPLPSTLFEQRAQIEIRIQNLSESPIEATGIDLSLVVNNRRLARGVDNRAISIAPLSDTTTKVVVSSSVFDTIRQLLTLGNVQTFRYGLKGKLFTSGLNHRFSRSGEISREDLSVLAPKQSAPIQN